MNIFYMTGCTFVSKKIPNRSNLINTKIEIVGFFFFFIEGRAWCVLCGQMMLSDFRVSSISSFERKKNSNSNIGYQ